MEAALPLVSIKPVLFHKRRYLFILAFSKMETGKVGGPPGMFLCTGVINVDVIK